MLWKLPEISVPADKLFNIGPFPVYNTFLIAVLSALVVLAFFYFGFRKAALIPRPFQNLVEWVSELLLNLCEEVAGKENGRRFFPWVATIFMLVLVANWWEVIPGVETIGTPKPGAHLVWGIFLLGDSSNQLTAWLRPPSTDLNFTLALAVASVVITQIYGFKVLGARLQLSRYFTLREGIMGLIVGALEAVLELVRVLSFSFRLFGNLFAGDVLLLVMMFLVPVVGAIPFYILEVFVGFIQAFVFAMLTLVFLTLGTTVHGHADEEERHTAEIVEEERRQAMAALGRGGE